MRAILTVRAGHSTAEIVGEHKVLLASTPEKYETILYQDVAYTVLDIIHLAEPHQSIDGKYTEPITAIEVMVKP